MWGNGFPKLHKSVGIKPYSLPKKLRFHVTGTEIGLFLWEVVIRHRYALGTVAICMAFGKNSRQAEGNVENVAM